MERTFAANIALKELLETKCVSHAKLAAAVGMRTDILSRIINCKRPIYADEVQPFCRALGVSVTDILRPTETEKIA